MLSTFPVEASTVDVRSIVVRVSLIVIILLLSAANPGIMWVTV